MSLSISGEGRLNSAADVSVTLRGVGTWGGGLAGGDEAQDADVDEDPTAESRLAEDSEPEVDRRLGDGRGWRLLGLKAAGMWSEAVMTQLSSSDPPSVYN